MAKLIAAVPRVAQRTEVTEKARRRSFTAAYKRRILTEADDVVSMFLACMPKP